MIEQSGLGVDGSWIDKLFQWANDNNVPELEYFEDLWEAGNSKTVDDGFWHGLPRNKEAMLSMTELNLDWHDLTELPGELGNLRQLTKISCCKEPDGLQAKPSPRTDNQLTCIPDWITDLPNLRSICFSGNAIELITEGIGNLVKLETLWLSENKIQNIPKSIGRCARLKQLELRSNEIMSIPESLSQCRDLEYLSLDSNQITRIPESLYQCSNLEYLSLSCNQVAISPRDLGIAEAQGWKVLSVGNAIRSMNERR